MVEIVWDDRFRRIYRKWCRQHPDFQERFARKIVLFERDAFPPSLKIHALSGVLRDLWSFSISYDPRVVFTFLDDGRRSVLLD